MFLKIVSVVLKLALVMSLITMCQILSHIPIDWYGSSNMCWWLAGFICANIYGMVCGWKIVEQRRTTAAAQNTADTVE